MDRDHHDPRGVLPTHSVLALAILMVSAPAWSLGVGRPQAASSLGQPLNLLFPVQLNPGESLTPECVRAEVTAGENPLSASGLHWQIEGDANRITGVRLRSMQRIDEPIVAVQLSVGCPARLTRQFTAFIDPPGMNAEPMVDPGQAPVPSISPALQAQQDAQPRAPQNPVARPSGSGAGQELSLAAAATPSASASGDRPRRPQRRAEARPGPTPQIRAGVTRQTPEARAARPSAPRLTMEPAEALQTPSPTLLAAEAAASAASAAEESRQQMLVMQKQMADMQAEQKRTLAAMNTLRQELQAAREQAAAKGSASSGWVLGLSLLSLALAASSLLMWRSNRLQKRESEQHWLGDSRQDPHDPSQSVQPVPTGPSPFTPTDPHSSPAPLMSHLSSDGPVVSSAPSTIPMPLSPLDEPTRPAPLTVSAPPTTPATAPAMPASRLSARPPTTAADDALDALAALDAMEPLSLQLDRGDTQPAPFTSDLGGSGGIVTVEELIDLEQQVDFFLVLGQDDAAIELLSSRLNHRDAASGLPFLKLMELYQRRGDREAFDRVASRFAEQFHARSPSWSDDLNEGEGLERHEELVERLEAAWPDAEGSMSLLQDLLSSHQEYSGDLGLPAYRDLLLLYAVARDRAEHEIDGNAVDLVLPLDVPGHPEQMATMAWQAPVPAPGTPAPPRSSLTQSVDLDLSLVEDEPQDKAKGG
ncbi:FimV family protein [Roseateles sp. So40a]|uniref:type IV pilus assembly protein FimV n=1 Tax=Roseateles sp. So40a TaxID=3400226 RepID=UPI003A88A371